MLDLSDEIVLSKREAEYQTWLVAHPAGVVLSLRESRDGH